MRPPFTTGAASDAVTAARRVVSGPRARSAGRRLIAEAAARGIPVPGGRGRVPVEPERPGPAPSDRDLTLQLMAELGHRGQQRLTEARAATSDGLAARRHDVSGLPHRLTTDRNLSFFLGRAGAASEAIIGRGAPAGPPITTAGSIDQASANDAIVNSLHQLDHRSLDQREQLDRLEAALLDIMRRLERLEQMETRPEPAADDRARPQSPALAGRRTGLPSTDGPPNR